jgi:mRNA interferase MazF
MIKEFDRWNDSKKILDQNKSLVDFHEREIWWCSIGVNVGSEQDSYSADFSRPVIIAKKFTERTFWGVPLTTKIRLGEYRLNFQLNGVSNDMLVCHMRSFDRKRLISKIGLLPKKEFNSLIYLTVKMFVKSMKTPYEGVFEAEARGCTDVQVKSLYPYNRSIEDQERLSRFFGDRYPYHYLVSLRSNL